MASAEDRAKEHELALAVCRSCGLVQLAEPFPYQDLTPPYDWITYREPEKVIWMLWSRTCCSSFPWAHGEALSNSFQGRHHARAAAAQWIRHGEDDQSLHRYRGRQS